MMVVFVYPSLFYFLLVLAADWKIHGIRPGAKAHVIPGGSSPYVGDQREKDYIGTMNTHKTMLGPPCD